MRATLCLLADFDSENFLRDFMVEASAKEGVGVAAGNLPRHISLGFPYEVGDWNSFIGFAERLSKRLSPVKVTLSDMVGVPVANVTGSYFFTFSEDFGLDKIRLDVVRALNSELGLNVLESDNVTGKKTITLGFGTAPFENYMKYVEEVDKTRFAGKELRFDELGIFYYDSEKITATSFMCAKRFKLN